MANYFLKVDKDLFKLGLNPTEILLLAQIIEFNTNTGDCFMSNQKLAEQFGVSEKTISRAVANLESKGLIRRDTKNVQKGKERHMTADMSKIAAFTKDNLTLGNTNNNLTKDKMTLAEETNCPLRKGQNDSIKDNTNNINKEDKRGIDEESLTSFGLSSSIPEFGQGESLSNPICVDREWMRKEYNQKPQNWKQYPSVRVFYHAPTGLYYKVR